MPLKQTNRKAPHEEANEASDERGAAPSRMSTSAGPYGSLGFVETVLVVVVPGM